MAVFPRETYTLNLKSRTLELGKRTLVMGVLNVTRIPFPIRANAMNIMRPLSVLRK